MVQICRQIKENYKKTTQMRVNIKSRSRTVSVRNNTALVTWLRKHDSEQLATNEEYMQAYAKRKELFNKDHIRFVNEDVFVEDLVRLGYIALI